MDTGRGPERHLGVSHFSPTTTLWHKQDCVHCRDKQTEVLSEPSHPAEAELHGAESVCLQGPHPPWGVQPKEEQRAGTGDRGLAGTTMDHMPAATPTPPALLTMDTDSSERPQRPHYFTGVTKWGQKRWVTSTGPKLSHTSVKPMFFP